MFRAFQDMDLSLWQSAVAEVFQEGSEEERKATIEATSDYCELSFAAEGDISTTELLERLGDKPSAFTSAVHHRLATAQLFLSTSSSPFGPHGEKDSRRARTGVGKD